MFKRIIALLLVASLGLFIGCSSSEEGAETPAAQADDEIAAEGSDYDEDEVEEIDDDEVYEEIAEDDSEIIPEEGGEAVSANEISDEIEDGDFGFEEDELSGSTDASAAVADGGENFDFEEDTSETPPMDIAYADEPMEPMDEMEPMEQNQALDQLEGDLTEDQTVDEAADSIASYDSEPPAKKWISVKKIKDTPFDRSGSTLNTVYILRKGDTLSSVSQKIYGMDRVDEILKWNPHLNRTTKPGNKLYYNSPKRPGDSSTLLTFYEDNGIPASTYVSQAGDNIRSVSKNLLGFEKAWLEVWATNPNVESKGVLDQGIELRYWPSSEGATPPPMDLANNTTDPVDMEDDEPMNAPPPPPDLAMNTPPKPPGPESTSMGSASNKPPEPPSNIPPPPEPPTAAGMVKPPPPPVANNVVPPPPPSQVVKPPPPPPKRIRPQRNKANGSSKSLFGIPMNDDMIFMVGAGAVVLIGAFFLLAIIKRGRSRKMSEGQTQV